MTQFEYYGFSDIGPIRSNNEDIIASMPDYNFFVIADGMGGHKAGEIAAKEAASEVCNFILTLKNPLSQKKILNHLKKAILQANKKVFTLGKENQHFSGMGTTLCCLHFHKDIATFAHVGDSRIYLFRKNNLIQLTSDHSLKTKLISSGQLSHGENLPLKYKNIITKAIGTLSTVEPTLNFQKTLPEDIYFMCTDGLSDYLSHNEMIGILNYNVNTEETVKNLIEAAKNNGSRDNISTLLIKIK